MTEVGYENRVEIRLARLERRLWMWTAIGVVFAVLSLVELCIIAFGVLPKIVRW